ncbi:hypothetical protein C1N51_27510 (plasmid) [Vibrio campbellii]|nr:hypothetical protein C1N51_27510 [Vibrio campbellii]
MKILRLFLCFLPMQLHAHGMYPTGVQEEKVIPSSIHHVTFTLYNAYEKSMCYEVHINGQLMSLYTTCLNEYERKNLTVPVLSPANQWSNNEVCTISPQRGMNRTLMCLETNTYFFAPEKKAGEI